MALRFTFKREAIWMLVLSLGLPLVGLLVILFFKLIP